MIPAQIRAVQVSWRQVLPFADSAAHLFFQKLFSLDPSLKQRFDGVDLCQQGEKLCGTFNRLIKQLDQPQQLLPALHELGLRHRHYGITCSDYDTVGAALIWTLRAALGDQFTHSLAMAWTDAYGLMAQVMINVSHDQGHRAPLR